MIFLLAWVDRRQSAPPLWGTGIGALLVLVTWLVFQSHGARREPRASVSNEVPGRMAPAQVLLVASGSALGREAASTPTERAGDISPSSTEPPGPIDGRLQLDGSPPPAGAQVLFRTADKKCEGWAPLDPDGRFWIEAPAATELVLVFALQAPNARLLLLPRQEVSTAPGATTRLDLDWHTQQVNLRVIGAADAWNPASVHLIGPDHDDRFETGDDGKVELDLVGSGFFRFEAVHPTGRRGEATLELQPDAELESVVIALGDTRSR